MANTVQKTVLQEGPMTYILHTYMQADGTGELNNFTLIDPSRDFTPIIPTGRSLRLSKIWYELAGFNITFAWGDPIGESLGGNANVTANVGQNATPPGPNYPFWVATPGASLRHDWTDFGGMPDLSDPPFGFNSSGHLVISTQGFTSPNARGAFVLQFRKIK